MQESNPQSGLLVTTGHCRRGYHPKSPSLHSFMSISDSTKTSYRTSRNASRSASPCSRNRRDSIVSLKSLTELNSHGDYDSFLPALDGITSWDNCHSITLSAVSSDLIENNSIATPSNLSGRSSPTGISQNQRQSIMNSNFSAAAGNASVMSTRQPAETLKYPSPFPPPSNINIQTFIATNSSGTTPSTISSQGQTTSRPQSPVSASRTSFDSVCGNWLVRPPDETSSDGDTDRGEMTCSFSRFQWLHDSDCHD